MLGLFRLENIGFIRQAEALAAAQIVGNLFCVFDVVEIESNLFLQTAQSHQLASDLKAQLAFQGFELVGVRRCLAIG